MLSNDFVTIAKAPGRAGIDAAWDGESPEELQASIFETIAPASGFSGYYKERRHGDILVADIRCAPLWLKDRRGAAPKVVLQAVAEGLVSYRVDGAESLALPAGALLIRPQRAEVELRAERRARVVSALVPRHQLTPRFAADQALTQDLVLSDGSLPHRLLHSFVVGMADEACGAGGAPAAAVDGLGGLLSMVLAQMPQPEEALSDLAAQRAKEVLAYLRRNFANPGLSPAVLADDLGISVRYAHKLMSLTGRSFRQELIALRLGAARAAFCENRRPRQTIADIAISVGFNDLSQFNRHFRSAYGMSPRAARKLDESADRLQLVAAG